MSGGVVEYLLGTGASALFRAEAVSAIIGPEPGDTRVRVYVDGNPTPYFLDGTVSWMEAVRVWRRELRREGEPG